MKKLPYFVRRKLRNRFTQLELLEPKKFVEFLREIVQLIRCTIVRGHFVSVFLQWCKRRMNTLKCTQDS